MQPENDKSKALTIGRKINDARTQGYRLGEELGLAAFDSPIEPPPEFTDEPFRKSWLVGLVLGICGQL